MRKGFIYTVPLPRFSFTKTAPVLEFEAMTKQQGNPVILDDRQAFCFDMGYQFGTIDKEYDMVLSRLKED